MRLDDIAIRFATALVCGVLLSGCSALETRALSVIEKSDGVHIVEVVSELHLAVAAVRQFIDRDVSDPRARLVLEDAQATLVAMHVDAGDQRLALVVPAADTQAKDSATSTLTLKLGTRSSPVAGNEAEAVTTARVAMLADLYADHARTCDLALADSDATRPAQSRLWETVAHVSMSALAGYECALRRTGDSGTHLTELSIEIGFSTERNETEGLIVSVANVAIGSSATQDTRSENRLLLKFKSP